MIIFFAASLCRRRMGGRRPGCSFQHQAAGDSPSAQVDNSSVLTAGLLDDASDVGAPAIKRFLALSQEFSCRCTAATPEIVPAWWLRIFIGDMRPAAASAYGASAPGKLSNDAISGAPISRTASAATSC